MALRCDGHSAISGSCARLPDAGSTLSSENGAKRSTAASTAAWEWSATMIIAWSSRNASTPPPAWNIRSIWRSAFAIDVTWAWGPYLWECVSLSGSDSSRKSKRSSSTR